jgi:hypothetical protein
MREIQDLCLSQSEPGYFFNGMPVAVQKRDNSLAQYYKWKLWEPKPITREGFDNFPLDF